MVSWQFNVQCSECTVSLCKLNLFGIILYVITICCIVNPIIMLFSGYCYGNMLFLKTWFQQYGMSLIFVIGYLNNLISFKISELISEQWTLEKKDIFSVLCFMLVSLIWFSFSYFAENIFKLIYVLFTNTTKPCIKQNCLAIV